MGNKKDYWLERLEYHRRELEECDYECGLQGFEQAWQSLEESSFLERGSELANTAENPLAMLSYIVDFGFYPPPELLMVICEAYERYIVADGGLSLDQIFFGPPVPRVGNYAAQKNKQFLDFSFMVELMGAKRRGDSQEKAAEMFIAKHSLGVDVDAFLRSWRRRTRGK